MMPEQGAALAAIEAYLAARDPARARAAADAFLADTTIATSERVAAFKLRARAHQALADPRAAIVDLEGAMALAPHDARACNDLGIACADTGESERALVAFERATKLDSTFARAWNNYANALRGAGRLAASAGAFERAVAADAGYALAWANLGTVRREIGDDAGAEVALRRALALQPSQRVALVTLAGLCRAEGRVDEAAMLYADAARLAPQDATVPLMLSGTLAERDDLEGAARAADAALERDPGMLRAALARRLTLPMIALSSRAIDASRERYREGLEALERELPRRAATLSAERLIDELRWSNFLLAYQGEDDRPLQARFGTLVHGLLAAHAPAWVIRPVSRIVGSERIRVGFVSAFFRDGTAGRYFERWITDLPRERFEVFVYHTQSTVDVLAQRLAASIVTFRHCPRWRPSQLAPRIRQDRLDIVVFPELGMDATTFALASLALAPVQCGGWGHPVTSGLPLIDVFFTAGSMEPPDGAAHYTERLVQLPGIGTRYQLPDLPPVADRSRFGLPPDLPLLLCPQSLFKIHPEDDARFARVLAAVPSARLVLFEGRHPALTSALVERMTAACAAEGVQLAPRLHVLPQCSHPDYLQINACCDAMLDTSRWSGGNTALDALACGLPWVALPGRFMRGRQSAAILRLAGASELVAGDERDYVAIAARLVTDHAWREEMRTRLRAGRARVFDDPAPVAALGEALAGLAS